MNNKTTNFILGIFLLSGTTAQARMSTDLLELLPKHQSIEAPLVQQGGAGVVSIRAAEVISDLYSKPIVLELEIENLAYEKEFYVVNHSHENQRNNRDTQAKVANAAENIKWTGPQGQAQLLYSGTYGSRSRFLLVSPGLSPNTYIDIYVKMAGLQYSTRVKIGKF